ncbi:SPOR domain-containing protein [Paenibacillus alkalitolerans]|uniref:SPOR domain-containing protein n=1 Tax=Paenibacillus alkalitolerans TaxID=2799335 RepID=UPI0018F6A7DA|nr:SPOR domain-containing protein [Paenibacillus alkalitolerans]
MSKARITYRFESARKTTGQAAAEANAPDTTTQQSKQGPTVREADERVQRSNVIPLRHDEFRLAEDTIVIEERHPVSKHADSKEGTGPADVSTLNSYPYDYGAWSSNPSEEVERLERIIRETDEPIGRRERSLPANERGRIRQPEDDEPDEREDDSYAEGGYVQPRNHRRYEKSAHYETRDGGSWWKVGASVVGAIATGVLFGSFVLSMFTGDPGGRSASNPLQGEQSLPASDTSQSAAAGAAVNEASEEAAFAAINIPTRDLYLLQNGKFSTLDNARMLADQMKSKGLAATIEESGSFWVYAGVTSNRDAALRVSRRLQDDGIEVFIKKYNLPEVKQVRWAGENGAETLSSYLNQGSEMIRMIGDLTLVHLDGAEPTAPEKSTVEKVLAEHRSFMQLSADALSGLPAEAQPMFKRMDGAVRNAVVAMQEYSANPSTALLWSAQSAIMDYVIAEKQLLTTIALK